MSAVVTTQETAMSKSMLGFWVYIMSDCVLFATLFATYAVMHANTAGGPAGAQIFDLHLVLGETMILLTSSFTCGLGLLAAQRGLKRYALLLFAATFALGALFLGLELNEFHSLAVEGNSWRRSGFLSAYFTLVGTHGLHITVGLVWMLVVFGRIIQRGLDTINIKRLMLFSLFWHFLDVVWIFIFTMVYLLGSLGV